MNDSTDDPLGPAVEADTRTDSDLYEVAPGIDECARVEGMRLPRRPGSGRRGVLLIDDPAGLVYVLDADDDARVFRARARRMRAGNTTDLDYPADGTDHVLRAAYETDYDVIAAPWVGDTPPEAHTGGDEPEAQLPAADAPRPRTRRTGGRTGKADTRQRGGETL